MKVNMKILMIYVMMLNRFLTWSQTDRLDSLLSDVLGNEMKIVSNPDTSSSFMALYGGINFDSKTFYAGREIGDDMYNMNGYLFFFHSKGFFFGASGSWYSQLDPGYSSTVMMAGYSKTLNKKKGLSFRTSYSRYFYYQPDPELDYGLNNSLGAGLALKNKWIGGRLSTRLWFGTNFGMDLSPVLFSRFTLFHIGKYDDVQFEPELSFLISSETIASETSGSNSRYQTETATKDVYGLLNSQLFLPVCISWRDFDLELSYTINLPTTQGQTITYPVSSFFSVLFGYLLPIY